MNEYVKTNILPFRYLTLNSHFLSHKIFLEKMTKKTPFWLFFIFDDSEKILNYGMEHEPQFSSLRNYYVTYVGWLSE